MPWSADRRRSLASGLIWTPLSSPLPTLTAFAALDEAFDEPVVDALLDDEAGGCGADLAGIAELGGGAQAPDLRSLGVVADDHRRMPAELHDGRLHRGGAELAQMLADRDGPGEGDRPDDRRSDQMG